MRAQGLDVSHYQRAYVPQAHHDFVIIKASDGLWTNYLFDTHLFEAEPVAFVGAYHYLRSGYSVAGQIDTLLNTAVNVDFYACDFEKFNNSPSAKFARDAEEFCREVTARTNLPCLFYSNPSIIQEWMFQYGVYWVRDYADLWIAQWPYCGWNNRLYEVPDEAKGWSPRLPAGCTQWRVWQFSADNNGKGAENGVTSPDVDLDVFNGTDDDFLTWLGKGEVEEPEDKPFRVFDGFHLGSWTQNAAGVEIVIRGDYE